MSVDILKTMLTDLASNYKHYKTEFDKLSAEMKAVADKWKAAEIIVDATITSACYVRDMDGSYYEACIEVPGVKKDRIYINRYMKRTNDILGSQIQDGIVGISIWNGEKVKVKAIPRDYNSRVDFKCCGGFAKLIDAAEQTGDYGEVDIEWA